ncbi:MAG: alpha-2-macroglobulin family protein [Thermoanaerobaculia bacterium]
MASDGLWKRSLLVRHKNLPQLHFRAYAVDLMHQVRTARDYNLLPGYAEVRRILKAATPAAEWTVELPETPDYRLHQTYVVPPLPGPGLYLLVASARRDFGERLNRQAAVNLLVGDLVLLTRLGDRGFEVSVRSGASGKAVAEVEVSLYRFDYRRGHRRVATQSTGPEGRVTFELERPRRDSFFVVAQRGEEVALDSSHLRFHGRQPRAERTSALIYTDRSVYRPQQKILWKVVGYRGGGEEGRFRTLPSTQVSVELVDPNGQVVESASVRTNLFGSASGEFRVPVGRLLGDWSLRASLGGQTRVKVEEYKRPTFEVTLLDPESPLRLNRPATLAGEVRYYFGLPVVSGRVEWRVSREPVYPRWWLWGLRRPSVGSQTLAAGSAELDAEGRFRFTFTPEADERQAAQGITYRYRLSVDVTDEGGETRSASRSFRLGFVAVEARLESEAGFFRRGAEAAFRISRSDLNGVPRPGRGSWRLMVLEQPERVLLPAEQPVPEAPAVGDDAVGEAYRTPGDRLRPRWGGLSAPRKILRQWPDGREIGRGEVAHGEGGEARLAWPDLSPGAYRLHYSTRDDFGALFETSSDFIVAEPRRTVLALPAVLLLEQSSVAVGGTARLLLHSGLPDQEMVLELFRDGRRLERRRLESAEGAQILEIPIGEEHRGGFGVRLSSLRDHQLMTFTGAIAVPWDDRKLEVEFATFRDLLRPGSRETWRVRVRAADEATLGAGSAELLAYMYDRSLDLFAAHAPPNPLSLYPTRSAVGRLQASLGARGEVWRQQEGFAPLPGYPSLHGDRLKFFDGYGIGGPGLRRRLAAGDMIERMEVAAEAPLAAQKTVAEEDALLRDGREAQPPGDALDGVQPPPEGLRTDFSETAFWEPHLLSEEDGTVAFEFTVPDSVTEWNVWVHALTRDLRSGSRHERTRSVKELMVRPYLPRFLREGDRAQIVVLVNNAGEEELSGELDFEILDPETDQSLLAEFGLSAARTTAVAFSVPPGGGAELSFAVEAPDRVGMVAFRVVARAGDLSDGELRPLPLLPGRMHLSQSRFAALSGADRRVLRFPDLEAGGDPTLLNEQMVVTLDAQLFYSVLHALPYLVNYPYECTEQSLNRFVSTGILTSLYRDYPAVARMAEEFSRRETRFETWEALDPNRKMALEETPWLLEARGGGGEGEDLVKVLDPRIARAERAAALAKLRKAQTSLGGFPWWPGGPPSPYMTLYILYGFSKALEFDVEVPREVVVRAWGYMHRHYLDEMVRDMVSKDCCWEMVTFLNFVLSSVPVDSWTGGVFTQEDRRRMLEFSFRHWRSHSPLLKGYLALTLERVGRSEDARLVFDSVMDSAKTDEDLGTYWAPEDRAWLWYNDTIESHAFALRVLTELAPDDARRHGLVQWLLLNKKLNHWKSTRATAEAIYALVHYLEREGALAVREEAAVSVGRRHETFVFEPDAYTGRRNQIVLRGEEIDPTTTSTIVVEKETPGFLFASATWHFSTERLPEEARGDFFSVTRRFFKRLNTGQEWVLQPLDDGSRLAPGDQVEVHLSIRAQHAAEYVHLRDPRGAGFEPETTSSRYRWDLGIGWYEEVRDSGTNFFFDWLPAGEYTFKYRLRANVAGTFKVAPATLQSMYAPEFTAYSSGAAVAIGAGAP